MSDPQIDPTKNIKDGTLPAGVIATNAINATNATNAVKTAVSDPTFADNSTETASTSWVRGAMSAIAAAAGFAISLTGNGYIKFPSWLGGLILQWGSAYAGTTTSTITFPITFPHAVFSVITTPNGNGGSAFAGYPQSNSAGSFVYFTSGASYLNWFAAGY